MTATSPVRRTEIALGALVALAPLMAVVVVVDFARFHLPALLAGGPVPLHVHDVMLMAMLAVELVVLARAVRSGARQVAMHRRLRALTAGRRQTVAGREVRVVAGEQPRAFCVGVARPVVVLTDRAHATLTAEEVRAVVAHESCHLRRRDPLRLAIVQLLSDGLGWLSPFRRLPATQAAVADLAADAGAVAALGSPRPLAAAMLRFPDPRPERIDQLLGRPLAAPARTAVGLAVVVVVVLAVVAVALAVAPTDPRLPLALLPVLAAPGLLACGARDRRPGPGR